MYVAMKEKIPMAGFESDFKSEIAVTSRDVEVLSFILEMKFVSVDEIHQKFFKITRSGRKSVSVLWARKRLLQLEKAGFLLRLRTFSEIRRYYAVSDAGFAVVSAIEPFRFYCRPVRETDFFTFDHDRQVLISRMVIESQNLGVCWISEKHLSENNEYQEQFSKELRPDGLYILSDGKKIAFEFEIAAKAKARYREK
ncbi:MAG: hypothetical protein SGJ18_00300 [Pseudomonadota bacterium]|nr:hypothetical protein [Pseudomonadota bacterium]